MWKKWTNGILGLLIAAFGFGLAAAWVTWALWVVGILALAAAIVSCTSLDNFWGWLSLIASLVVIAAVIWWSWSAWLIAVLGLIVFGSAFALKE